MSYVLLAAAVALGAAVFRFFFLPMIATSHWYVHKLRGPPSPSFLWGRFWTDVWQVNPARQVQLFDTYGKVFSMPGPFGVRVMTVADHAVASEAYAQHRQYYKTPEMETMLGRLWGHRSVFINDEDLHRRLRRVMSPAFSLQAARNLFPEFLDGAYALHARLEAGEVDMLAQLNRTTLDIFGSAGLGTEALGDPRNELGAAFTSLLAAITTQISPLGAVQLTRAGLVWIPTATIRNIDRSRRTIERIGRTLVARASAAGADEGNRDLLSLLVRSNAAQTADRLDEDEILHQITSLLFAGHDTTSSALSFALYHLAGDAALQAELRSELECLPDYPAPEALESCTLLNDVIREVLRLVPPVASTARQLTADHVVRLSAPVTLKSGEVVTSLPLRKGEMLAVSTIAVNRDRDIWGADAGEFNPRRFARPHTPAANVAGAWGNLLTFSHGPRNCIGFRFALAEMRAVLFVLLRHWDFARAKGVEVEPVMGVTVRPFANGDRKHPSCPLFLTPVH